MSEYIYESNINPGFDRMGNKIEEIVRCKNCAWFDPYTDEDEDGLCVGACFYFAHLPKVTSNGFCHWAVKIPEKMHNHA